MKKQCSFILAMLLGLIGFTASAFPVTVNVKGDCPVLWGDMASNMHNEIPVGDGQTIDFYGMIYFTTPAGYTLITHTINCEAYTTGAQEIEAIKDNERVFQRTFYNDRNYTVDFVTRSDDSASDIVFLLQNGTAALYRENETSGEAAELVQELKAGKAEIAPLIADRNYFIVAGEGVAPYVTDKDGKTMSTYEDTQEFNRYVCKVAGGEANFYTITTKAANLPAPGLYLVGEGSGFGISPEFKFTEGDDNWTLSVADLSGKFRIKSDDYTINLGSNGNPVELNVPYTPAKDAQADMELACGSVTDATITVDKDGYKITVNGTVGIATISRDALDTNATYFDLQGRRINPADAANGIYIQVTDGEARKIAVK